MIAVIEFFFQKRRHNFQSLIQIAPFSTGYSIIHVTDPVALPPLRNACLHVYMHARERAPVHVCVVNADSYLGKRTRCRDTMNTSSPVSICRRHLWWLWAAEYIIGIVYSALGQSAYVRFTSRARARGKLHPRKKKRKKRKGESAHLRLYLYYNVYCRTIKIIF